MKVWSMGLVMAAAAATAVAAPSELVLQAEKAQFDSARAEVVERAGFSGGKGVMLKSGQKSRITDPTGEPDLTFQVDIPETGRYWISSLADTTGATREAMKKAGTKYDSLRVMIAVDDDFPRNRVLVVPWGNQNGCYQRLMKQDFTRGKHVIRIWMPEGSALDRLEITPYRAPKVPEAAQKYVPKIVPPASHPRLWVNSESLAAVKANLNKGANRAIWEQVQKVAAVPYSYKVAPRTAAEYDPKLQNAAVYKAFVYLMTGNRKLGEEAVKLMHDYLGAVEFGNMLDITREIGLVLYSGAQVYDWCYDLLTPEDRELFRKNLLRLAEDMEIGWPPFGQTIVNGHGNEAQVNRDLLAMSIALYGDYNLPYQYCAYRILEELVPLRNLEYQCNRHNQGVGYGTFRFGCEMHAAWLMYRMSGKRVFDDVINNVGYYWIYALTPAGTMMPDGDGTLSTSFWQSPQTTFLCYAYTGDPILKADFERQGGTLGDPIMFLLLNDPELKAEKSIDTLPLTHYFKGVLASMIARTGWNIGKNSPDVFVEMKGGGYHFGNHQHADAGAFQIYYRGWLATDLGMYHFYGTPYDFGYNKRSIAHNVMLAYQPDEKFLRGTANDGGQRFNQTCPTSVQQLLSNPHFKYGETLAADFGPDAKRPFYSYFKADLAPAYSDKIEYYTRAFCFLNLADAGNPAALITVDRMKTVRSEYRKFWLINSLTEPKITGNEVRIISDRSILPGRLDVRMLLPRKVKVETAGKGNATKFFGANLKPPVAGAAPAQGWRTMFSPAEENSTDVFVSVMQVGEPTVEPLPVELIENHGNCQITLGNRVVVLGTSERPVDRQFTVKLPQDRGDIQVLLTDLMAGIWNFRNADGKINYELFVSADKSTAFLVVPGGEYTVSPGAASNAVGYEAPRIAVPEVRNPISGHCLIDGKPVAKAPDNRVEGDQVLVPAEAVFTALGGRCVAGKDLTVELGGRKAVFRDGSRTFTWNGDQLDMAVPAQRVDGVWYVCDAVPAGLAGYLTVSDATDRSSMYFKRTKPAPVMWLDSNCGLQEDDLAFLLDAYPGKSAYWATNGAGKTFTLTFPEPRRLDGVELCYYQGATRAAKFKLEVSDGKGWKTVYDGETRKSSGPVLYSFPAQKVCQLRFTGNGNSANEWNSIISMVPHDAK